MANDTRSDNRIREDVRAIAGVRDVENQVRPGYGRLDEALNDLAATGGPERDKTR